MGWRPEPKPFYGGWGEPKYRFEYDVAERLGRLASRMMGDSGAYASIRLNKSLEDRWDCLWHHTSTKKAKETFAFELAARLEKSGRRRPRLIGLSFEPNSAHVCAVPDIGNPQTHRTAMQLFENAMGGYAYWVMTGY